MNHTQFSQGGKPGSFHCKREDYLAISYLDSNSAIECHIRDVGNILKSIDDPRILRPNVDIKAPEAAGPAAMDEENSLQQFLE
jgi:hypothetical protein